MRRLRIQLRPRLHSALALALLSQACGGEGGSGPVDSGRTDGADDGATSPEASSDTGVVDHASPDGGVDVVSPDGGVDVMIPDASCGADVVLPSDSGSTCTSYAPVPCGYDGGGIPSRACAALCPVRDGGIEQKANSCYGGTVDGVTVLTCEYCLASGRRVEGLTAAPPVGETAASFFVHAAWLEAASVPAFRRLARELTAHGAPPRLVDRARRAAREEARHTRATERLARRFGGCPVRPRATKLGVRGLREIALENAVEGCVRETYGALVAMWQAARAEDLAVRATLSSIARDEAGHAELAWEATAWLESRLDAKGRLEVARARDAAVEALRVELWREPSRELRTIAGMPSRAEALRLLEAAVGERVFYPIRRAA